jgi:hypothetical protein
MIVFVVILTEIVREKEKHLRLGLTLMGMSSTAYWMSWGITALLFSTIVSNLLVLSGIICGFDVFCKAPYAILCLLFTSFTFAMSLLAFWCSTLISTTKTAYTTSYAFLISGMVL